MEPWSIRISVLRTVTVGFVVTKGKLHQFSSLFICNKGGLDWTILKVLLNSRSGPSMQAYSFKFYSSFLKMKLLRIFFTVLPSQRQTIIERVCYFMSFLLASYFAEYPMILMKGKKKIS